jgi:hypothetical protein
MKEPEGWESGDRDREEAAAHALAEPETATRRSALQQQGQALQAEVGRR